MNTSLGDELLVSRVDQWLTSSSLSSGTEDGDGAGESAAGQQGPVDWRTPTPGGAEFEKGVRVHMDWRRSAVNASSEHKQQLDAATKEATSDAEAEENENADETGGAGDSDSTQAVLQVSWHARGDYWASVREQPLAHRSLLVHQLSRRRSQVRLLSCVSSKPCAVYCIKCRNVRDVS